MRRFAGVRWSRGVKWEWRGRKWLSFYPEILYGDVLIPQRVLIRNKRTFFYFGGEYGHIYNVSHYGLSFMIILMLFYYFVWFYYYIDNGHLLTISTSVFWLVSYYFLLHRRLQNFAVCGTLRNIDIYATRTFLSLIMTSFKPFLFFSRTISLNRIFSVVFSLSSQQFSIFADENFLCVGVNGR